MKRQVSPAIIIAAVAVVAVALGALFFRQVVYTEPTPRPNRGVDMGTTGTPAPTNLGK